MAQQEQYLQQQIDQLRTQLLVMGVRTRQALHDACLAVLTGDGKLANSVLDGDAAIDELENQIDTASLNILARNQPVARDLRLVVAGVRMVLDLERIGDEAVVIAERVILAERLLLPAIRSDFVSLMDRARSMLDDALTAFRDANSTLAYKVCREDDESAQLMVTMYSSLMEGVQAGTIRPWDSMHVILSIRALDRICRRAENLAEQTCFLLEGISLKHSRKPDRSGGVSV